MHAQHSFAIDNISIRFSTTGHLYQDFSMEIPQSQWLGILGPSGIGKTTLLHAIAKQLNAKNSELRISFLTQKLTLLPWLSNLDNVLLGDHLRGNVRTSSLIKARHLLEKVGLAHLGHLKPKQLSGGQCQRILIARTLYDESDIVIMDEPFSSLDAITKCEIQECAYEHLKSKTVVLVTHDPLDALRLCHQILVLHGRPVSHGKPILLYSQAPRQIDNPDVAQHHPELMKQLICAKSLIMEPA